MLTYIEENNIPETAVVFAYSSHSFVEEAEEMSLSRSSLDGYDSMVWEYEDYESDYDDDAIAGYNESADVTAVCIYG